MADRMSSYREFWPHYLREHAGVRTRALHYVGTALVLVAAVALLLTGNGWWALAMPIGGYGFAWFAHFFVEHNRPATFTYPFWSLISDFRMFFVAFKLSSDCTLVRARTAVSCRMENAPNQSASRIGTINKERLQVALNRYVLPIHSWVHLFISHPTPVAAED